MSNDFKEKYKLPENYRKAIEEVSETNRKRTEQIDEIMSALEEKNLDKKQLNIVRKTVEELIQAGTAKFELTPEELAKFTTIPTEQQQKAAYMKFIKDQAKGFFMILELIKEQIRLLIDNGQIDKDVSVNMYARVKGLESAINNEDSNEGQLEGKLKVLDDVFGITIVAKDKKDILTIKKHISNSLIKVMKSKPINKSLKDKNGNILLGEDGKPLPGYTAVHDTGYINDKAFEWLDDIKVDGYKEQIAQCIKEDKEAEITLDDLEEIDKKVYTSSEELPVIEIHYQSEEEYERAKGVASHTAYKQRRGKENVVFIQQKYLHEEFHRFVDLPIMFEWTSHDDKVRLLDRDETLFTMYPYLRQLQAKKEQMTH
ncbi:MAG: hypothetical protein E7310_06970 [Clostridiales bacterium]|nr:hypothetical protein [Clostridiales bacterium]